MLLCLLKDFDHDGQKFLKDQTVEIADEAFAKSLMDGDDPTAITQEEYLRKKARESAEVEAAKRPKPTITKVRARFEDDPMSGFKDFGQFARVVRKSDAKSDYGWDERLKTMQGKAITGMGEFIDSDGGFLVPEVVSQTIRERVYAEQNLIARTEQLTTAGNSLTLLANAETSRATGSRQGGVRGYWMDEAGQFTASKPTFRRMTLKLHKLGVFAYVTDEMLEDSFTGLGAYLTTAAGREISFMVSDAMVNGNGANAPQGLLTAPCLVSVAKETGQAAATIVSENIFKMYARMWAPSWPSSAWFINQSILPQLLNLNLKVGTGGVPVYLPPGGISVAPYGMLMGRPIVPIEWAAALGTVGDIILADWSQYVSISKGVQTAMSIHLRFDYGEQVYRFSFRVDAQPLWNSALTPYKDTEQKLSPFVVLASRS